VAGFLATAARHRRGTFLWRVRYELQLASGWLMLAPLLVALVLLAGTQVLAAIFTGPTPPGEWSLQQTAVVIWLFPWRRPSRVRWRSRRPWRARGAGASSI